MLSEDLTAIMDEAMKDVPNIKPNEVAIALITKCTEYLIKAIETKETARIKAEFERIHNIWNMTAVDFKKRYGIECLNIDGFKTLCLSKEVLATLLQDVGVE